LKKLFLETFIRKLLDDVGDANNNKETTAVAEPMKIPGKAVQLIDNNVVEEKPFYCNDELPETELYFGGEKETESERDIRLIRISQREEMARL